jgi:hypothetical protein
MPINGTFKLYLVPVSLPLLESMKSIFTSNQLPIETAINHREVPQQHSEANVEPYRPNDDDRNLTV